MSGTGHVSPLHLFNVLRCVEANALAAGLVKRAEDWKWGSLWERVTKGRSLLEPLPSELIECPDNWIEIVNDLQPEPGTPGSDPFQEGSDP